MHERRREAAAEDLQSGAMQKTFARYELYRFDERWPLSPQIRWPGIVLKKSS
jgi:hypothetical protein